MKIKFVRFKNMKGTSREFLLGPLNYIVGDNGAGKSTVADAMTLALAGYHPNVGGKAARTNDAVMQLASADSLDVEAEFDDGSSVRRQWTRGKKGVSKREAWSGLPDGWSTPPVLLDVKSYLEMSDAQRVDYVFALAKVADLDVTPERLRAAIKNIKLEENTEHTEAALGDIAQAVDEAWRDAGSKGVQAFLADLVAKVAERQKLAAAAVKRMNLTVQGLEQLRAEAALAGQPPDPQAERRLDDARRRRDELRTQKGQIEERGRSARAAKNRVEEIEALLTAADAEQIEQRMRHSEELRARVKGYKPEAERLRNVRDSVKQGIAELERQIKTARAAEAEAKTRATRSDELRDVVGGILGLRRRKQLLEVEVDSLKQQTDGYKSKTAALRTAHSERTKELFETASVVDRAIEAFDKATKDRAALSEKESCPYCKCSGPGWKTAVELEIDGQISRAETAKSEASRLQRLKQLEADSAAAALEESVNADQAAQEKRDTLALRREELVKAGAALDAAVAAEQELAAMGDRDYMKHGSAADDFESALKRFNSEYENAVKALPQAEADEEQHKADAKKLEDEEKDLRELQTAHAQAKALDDERKRLLDSAGQYDGLLASHAKNGEESDQLDQTIAGLVGEQNRVVAARGESAKKAEALASALRAKADLDASKAAAELLAAEREQAVEKAFVPVLATANLMAEPLIGFELVYADGVIGRRSKFGVIGQGTFSGWQRSVTCCALAVALASESPVKLAVVDEVDATDENRLRLCALMSDLVEKGVVEQVILIATEAPSEIQRKGSPWNVVLVGK